MATYSDRLRLELMTTGEFSGTWGDRTNINMGTILEQAIAGLKTVTLTDADKTLTTATGNANSQGGTDYSDDEARYAILSIVSSEALTAGRNVIIPAKEKIYIIKNGTTGGQQLTIKTSSGTGLVIPNGKTMVLYCDGTNTQSAIDNFPAGTTIGGAEIATTTTGQTFQNKTIESSTLDSSAVGASTPSTGAFTTLTSSSTTTLDGTTIPSSKTLVDTDSTQTVTNKTIDADSNTISNIEVDNLKSGVLDTDLSSVAVDDTTIPSAKAVKTYVDAHDLDFAGDSGTGAVDLDSQTFTVTGGTGLSSTAANQTITLDIDSTVATLTGTQTLTNKTLTSPVIGEIVNGAATITVPATTGTMSLSDTTYTAGTGLELSGTEFSVNLGTATTNTATQASVGTADGRTYLVQTDSDGDLVVNVPWENTEGSDTTYSSGTGLTLTGTTFDANVDSTAQTVAANAVTATASRTYALQVDGSDNLVVNVPWVNTTYSAGTGLSLTGTTFANTAPDQTVVLTGAGATSISGTYPNFTITSTDTTYSIATSSALGLVKVGYTEDGKNYPVELDNEQMYVNVPWTDNDTTYSVATSSALGLVKVGYTESGKNYPVELDNDQMYVNVPWTDTTPDLSGYALLSGATFTGPVILDGANLSIRDDRQLNIGSANDLIILHDLVAGTSSSTTTGATNVNRIRSSGSGGLRIENTMAAAVQFWTDTFIIALSNGTTQVVGLNPAGMQLSSGSRVNSIKDEDDMSSNSATALATQQSIKAYADNDALGYATGTWNPSFSAAATTLTTQPTFSNANYTRIGRMVTVTCEIIGVASDGSALDDLRLNGLPFTVSGGDYAGSVRATRWDSGVAPHVCEAKNGTTYMLFYYDPDNSLGAQVNKGNHLQTGGTLNNDTTITLTYFTTS